METYYTSDPLEAWELSKMCLSGREGCIVVTTKSPCVWTGRLDTFDLVYCRENGIQVAYGLYLGGSVVAFPGDLSIMWITWGRSDHAETAALTAAEMLQETGANVTVDGNDILADGKKVASWCGATTLEGWHQGAVHFSINTDLALIRKICTKPMQKAPGQLSDYGITADDILAKLNLGAENSILKLR